MAAFEDKIGAQCGGSVTAPSLPPPRPPEYPDLYGKRRELAKVQMLEREIGFLEDELKSVEHLQPASRFCKEVSDFVVANSDPFTPAKRKNRRSGRFWRWLCGMPCFNLSKLCCCCCPDRSTCCGQCEPSRLCSCVGCRTTNCQCCSSSGLCPKLECCTLPSCASKCCKGGTSEHSCNGCKFRGCCPKRRCCVPKCSEVCCCSNCTKTCCIPCC